MTRLLSVLVLAAAAVAVAQSPQCPEFCRASTGQPGWILVSGPGVSSPFPAVSVSPYNGWTVLPGSTWVSVDPYRGNAAGDYTYEFTFCLCQAAKQPRLNLSFYADNGAKVLLNSTLVFATSGNTNFSGSPRTVSYTGTGWVPGTNKVQVVVHNDSSVTGLDAILTITQATAGACPRRAVTLPTQ